MKTLTGVMLTTLIICNINNGFAGDYKYTSSSSGAGYTKGDAVVSALTRVPYGAKLEKVNCSGSSTYKFVKGAGYVQVQGSHVANVIYTSK
jgi:hypothetical protein